LLSRLQDREAAEYVKLFENGKIARNDLIELLSGAAPKILAEKRAAPREEEKDLQTLISELEAEMGINLHESHDGVEPLVREFRRKSAEILEGDSKARIDMAFAFFEMGLYKDAREELAHIQTTDSRYLEAQMLFGEILCTERSDLGALEVFQNILRDDRTSPEIALEAKFKLLTIYHRLGDLRQALAIAKEMEKKTPGYRDTQHLLLQIQETLGGASEEEASAKPARREGAGKG
jgi:tetratricopeptide (TPR) repeat protein